MRLHRDERGIALITTVMATFVTLLLTVVAVGIGDHMNTGSRVDRKRVFSYHAAEAGLDRAIATLMTTGSASLPCSAPMNDTVDAGPGQGTYSVNFTYYATFPASGSPMTCPLTASPAGVVITSSGSTTDAISRGRRLQLAAKLTPGGSGFNKAVFSDATLDIDNSLTITGSPAGNDGNVYTNGDFICDNSGQMYGNVYAQGKIRLTNSCHIVVDAWANKQIEMVNSVNVGRDAKSSTLYVGLGNSATVGRNAIAGTAVCPPSPQGNCGDIDPKGNVLGSTIQNSPQPDQPPREDMPEMPYNETAWQTAQPQNYVIRGYTSCTTAHDHLISKPGIAEADKATNWTQPTVVRINPATPCTLVFQNSKEVTMRNHIAIFSFGGVEFRNSNKFKRHSSAPAVPKLHVIVPSAEPASNPLRPNGYTCTTPGAPGGLGDITMTNSTTFEAPIETFMYTPCNVWGGNSATMYGQIYGGKVKVDNSINMAYRPVGAVPGAPTASVGFTPSIAYKREISSS